MSKGFTAFAIISTLLIGVMLSIVLKFETRLFPAEPYYVSFVRERYWPQKSVRPLTPESYRTEVPTSTPSSPTTAQLDGIALIKDFYNRDEQTVAVRGIFGKEEKTLFSIESLREVRASATKRDFLDKGQTGCPHYSGACFSDVDVSPDRTKVVFGNSCLAGSCALPWTAVFDVARATTTFLGGGAGERFLWARDGKAVGYVMPIEGRGGETVAMSILSPTTKTVELTFSDNQAIATVEFITWRDKDGALLAYARAGNIGSNDSEKVTYILQRSGETQRISGWLDY